MLWGLDGVGGLALFYLDPEAYFFVSDSFFHCVAIKHSTLYFQFPYCY